MKQKALNVAVALAFGAVAAPSLAGTTSVTPRQFPSSIFGNPALSVAPVAYAISAPLAAGVTRYLYVRIDNSSKFAAGSVLAGDFKITDPAGTRPRLQFTAPTQIVVQSLLTNPDGMLTTIDPVTTTPNSSN